MGRRPILLMLLQDAEETPVDTSGLAAAISDDVTLRLWKEEQHDQEV